MRFPPRITSAAANPSPRAANGARPRSPWSPSPTTPNDPATGAGAPPLDAERRLSRTARTFARVTT